MYPLEAAVIPRCSRECSVSGSQPGEVDAFRRSPPRHLQYFSVLGPGPPEMLGFCLVPSRPPLSSVPFPLVPRLSLLLFEKNSPLILTQPSEKEKRETKTDMIPN